MEKKQKMIIGLLLAVLLIVGVGATYAYFTSDISGSESSTALTARGGEMKIEYDGGAYITLTGIYPSNTAWATKNFTVTGKNTTDAEMWYKITLVVEANTFGNDEISYSLTSSTPSNGFTAGNITDEYINGTESVLLGAGKFTKTGSATSSHNYTLTVSYPNKAEEQNVNQAAVLNCYIKTEDIQALDVPEKSDLITMSVGSGLPTSYRVLSIDGTEAKVVAMSNYDTSAYAETSTTATFSATSGLKYEGSLVDQLLNTTMYNSMNTDARRAIVKQTSVSQSMFTSSTVEPGAGEQGVDYWQHTSLTPTSGYAKEIGSVAIGARYIYLLDLVDVFDYFDNNAITGSNVNKLFFDKESAMDSSSENTLTLRSADGSTTSWIVDGSTGALTNGTYSTEYGIRPAFTINLSRVNFSVNTDNDK